MSKTESKTELQTMRDAVELAAENLPPDIELTFKSMFGGMGASVRGRMFASLSNVGLGLKLPTDAQPELLKHEGAAYLQYDADAPVSKSYVVVPSAFLTDTALLAPWVERSIAYALTLPAPKKKALKATAKA